MKAKVNLYNRHPKGRIDTYQFTPYKNDTQEHKQTILVDRQNRLNRAYKVNYSQACLLLQAIQVNNRQRLSAECISQLAIFVANAWESSPTTEKINELVKLMGNLLDTTMLSSDKPLDDALKEFCSNNIPTHTVSPSITLLIAIGYIDRLKQKYNNIKGTTGCGNRLILVAYMIASKFMHINLKSIINTSCNKLKLDNLINKDTPEQFPLSPPTSPRSDTNPLNYHFFPPQQKQPFMLEHQYQIIRMELEFLHFLDYDLSITFKLINWAKQFHDCLLPPIQHEYTSADEADDECSHV